MHATDVRTALAEQRKEKSEQSWFGIIKKTASEYMSDDAMTWAAAVACYTLLALAPLIVVAIKVGTVLLRNRPIDISQQAQAWMGAAAAQAVAEIVHKASQPGKGTLATIISLIIAVFSATGVFAELQAAMNRIWKVKQKPGQALWGFLRSRGLSLLVVLLSAILLLGSVVVATWLGNFTKSLGLGWKWVTFVVDVLVSVGVLTLLFALLYRTLPDAQIEWRSTWVGAVITAVLFEIGRFGLAFYFKYGAPSSAFGAFGALAAVLIWIFYSCQIVFFGAEFTYVYAQSRGHAIKPSEHARSLTKCDETETATPSDKPPPPGAPSANKQKRREMSPYGAVLAPHAGGGMSAARRVHPAVLHQLARQEATVHTYLAAGAGLAVGALLGGYGAIHVKEAKAGGKDAGARLRQRIRNVERKVGHVSRIQRLVEREDVIDRIDHLEDELKDAARKARRVQRRRHGHDDSWVGRAVEKVKSYF